MDIIKILNHSYPDSEWVLSGNSYDGLEWLSDTPKPTEAELTALWPQVQYETAYAEVENARRQAYTLTSDPLFFEWQRGDATEQEWRDAVQAVKDAHPYPEPPQ